MRKFLQNLLIFFALSLCALSAFQWVREARLRKEIAALNETNYEKAQTIQVLQSTVKKSEAEILRLDARNMDLKQIEKTNTMEIASLKRSLRKFENENETLRAQIEEYKKAVDQQNESIKKQNESIEEQNALLKKVAGERDEFVQKYNESVKRYNEVVSKYNDLVKLVEKLQAEAAKAAPAAK